MQSQQCLRTLVREDVAQDLIEYALLAGLLALVTVGSTQALGDTLLDTFWSRIAGMLDGLV